MKFNVTLQVLVNLRVANIEAENQIEAAKTADELVSDSYKLAKVIESETNCPIGAEWAELAEDPPAYALVDEVGDEEYQRSRWHFNHPATGWQAIDPLNNSLLEPASADAAAKLREALAQIVTEAEFSEDDGAMDLGERLLQIARLGAAALAAPAAPAASVEPAKGGEVA
jgi:hypothetical protein